MIHAVGSSLAGIFAHTTKVKTTAHNVANANTDGFKKDRVTIHSNESGLPEVLITKVDTPGHTIQKPEGEVEMSNVDLAEEMVNLTIGKNGYMANLKALEKEEEIFDSVLDIMA